MAIYTYSDFEKAVKDAGLLGEFSDADLRLAQSNPDAGMSLLKYKTDYKSAATDEARALANTGAEQVRSSYGGYTGGSDGGSFHLDPISPNDFTYGTAPSYTSRYDDKINSLIDAIANREQFSYNADTDPLYSQVKKTYTREGRRATADALADAAAATGGIPSSYAVTAATQAGDYYASQMSDKLQDLYQLAYNQYIQEHSMKISDLNAVRSAEQADYQKYLNELNQYNTDRSFNYGKHLDEINQQSSLRNEALTKAELAASVGDYSLLASMGIKADTESDKENLQYERQLELAKIAANAGDYSYLEKLLGGKVNVPAAASTGTGGNYSGYGDYLDDYDDPYDYDYSDEKDDTGALSGETEGAKKPTNGNLKGNAAAYEKLAPIVGTNEIFAEANWKALKAMEAAGRTDEMRKALRAAGKTDEVITEFDTYEEYLDFMLEFTSGS